METLPRLKFTYPLFQKVKAGTKTETRRLLTTFYQNRPAIKPSSPCMMYCDGQQNIIQVTKTIKEVKQTSLHEMKKNDFLAEGFICKEDFIKTWNRIHWRHQHNLWAANPKVVVVRW